MFSKSKLIWGLWNCCLQWYLCQLLAGSGNITKFCANIIIKGRVYLNSVCIKDFLHAQPLDKNADVSNEKIKENGLLQEDNIKCGQLCLVVDIAIFPKQWFMGQVTWFWCSQNIDNPTLRAFLHQNYMAIKPLLNFLEDTMQNIHALKLLTFEAVKHWWEWPMRQ